MKLEFPYVCVCIWMYPQLHGKKTQSIDIDNSCRYMLYINIQHNHTYCPMLCFFCMCMYDMHVVCIFFCFIHTIHTHNDFGLFYVYVKYASCLYCMCSPPQICPKRCSASRYIHILTIHTNTAKIKQKYRQINQIYIHINVDTYDFTYDSMKYLHTCILCMYIMCM
jgi:hypothetical protein